MPRVKRGKTHLKRRKNILSQTKGYMWGRKSKMRAAKVAILKAGVHAYRDRRLKKRVMRGLWLIRINAAARQCGLTYSRLMNGLKKADIGLDRKVLSELAVKHPNVFKAVTKSAKE